MYEGDRQKFKSFTPRNSHGRYEHEHEDALEQVRNFKWPTVSAKISHKPHDHALPTYLRSHRSQLHAASGQLGYGSIHISILFFAKHDSRVSASVVVCTRSHFLPFQGLIG